MASFNSLPTELVNRIIDLSVEDAVALEDNDVRKSILVKLAVVSKVFTTPAQKALWRYINSPDFKGKLLDVVKSRLTRNMIIQEVALNAAPRRCPALLQLLEGVQTVLSLELHTGSTLAAALPSILLLPSLQRMLFFSFSFLP